MRMYQEKDVSGMSVRLFGLLGSPGFSVVLAFQSVQVFRSFWCFMLFRFSFLYTFWLLRCSG